MLTERGAGHRCPQDEPDFRGSTQAPVTQGRLGAGSRERRAKAGGEQLQLGDFSWFMGEQREAWAGGHGIAHPQGHATSKPHRAPGPANWGCINAEVRGSSQTPAATAPPPRADSRRQVQPKGGRNLQRCSKSIPTSACLGWSLGRGAGNSQFRSEEVVPPVTRAQAQSEGCNQPRAVSKRICPHAFLPQPLIPLLGQPAANCSSREGTARFCSCWENGGFWERAQRKAISSHVHFPGAGPRPARVLAGPSHARLTERAGCS